MWSCWKCCLCFSRNCWCCCWTTSCWSAWLLWGRGADCVRPSGRCCRSFCRHGDCSAAAAIPAQNTFRARTLMTAGFSEASKSTWHWKIRSFIQDSPQTSQPSMRGRPGSWKRLWLCQVSERFIVSLLLPFRELETYSSGSARANLVGTRHWHEDRPVAPRHTVFLNSDLLPRATRNTDLINWRDPRLGHGYEERPVHTSQGLCNTFTVALGNAQRQMHKSRGL